MRPLLARQRHTPQRRTPDEHRLGTQGDGLGNVAAAPDTAVQHYIGPAVDPLQNTRQRDDRRDGAVQVAAAVIGDDHRVHATLDSFVRVVLIQHTLDHQRAGPEAAQLTQIIPSQRIVFGQGALLDRGAHQRLAQGIGQILELRHARSQQVTQHDLHQPARVRRQVQRVAAVQAKRQGETIVLVVFAVGRGSGVHRHNQRFKTGRLGAQHQLV